MEKDTARISSKRVEGPPGEVPTEDEECIHSAYWSEGEESIEMAREE